MLRPLRQKKGRSEILGESLIAIVLAVVVLAAVLAYAVSVGTDMRLMKIRAARDLALTIETAESAPGSVLFSYADAFGFQYGFVQNRVDVYLTSEETFSPSLTYYLFPHDSALNFILPRAVLSPAENQKTVISLKKSYPDFVFDQSDLSFSTTNCGRMDTSSEPKKVLILDLTSDVTYQKLIRDQLLVPSLSAAGIDSVYYDDESKFSAAIKSDTSAVIIEIEKYDYANVNILSVTNAKARRISCLINNNLARQNTPSSVVGTSSEDYPGLANPASLRIQIGNTMLGSLVLPSVADGIKEYFK